MRSSDWRIGLVAWGLGSFLAPPALAQQGEAGNRVSFHVETARAVANDRVEAVLAATAEDGEAARAAATVNEAMSWALSHVRGRQKVKVRTGSYSTQPVHEDGRIRRWRARQELRLAGEDVDEVSALVGELQSRLVLESFRFHVSDTRRRRVEDELIEEALAAFRERADLVHRSLDFTAWRIDEISIETGQGVVPMRRMAESRVAAAPAVEAGTSRIQLTVRGTIVLE